MNDQKYFPYLINYQSDDKKIGFFIYHYQFDSLFAWKAETTDGHSIIVKYLQEYNTEAHNLCAQKRLAPQLLHVSSPEELRKFQVVTQTLSLVRF